MIFHLQAQGADWGSVSLVSSDPEVVQAEGGHDSSGGIIDVLYEVRIAGAVVAGRNIWICCLLVQTERSSRLTSQLDCLLVISMESCFYQICVKRRTGGWNS